MSAIREQVALARERREAFGEALEDLTREEVLAACHGSEAVARRLRFDLFFERTPVNTRNLLEAIGWAAAQEPDLGEFDSFPSWCARYRLVEPQILARLPERFAVHLPLRDAVLPLVAFELTGRMPFTKEYVLQHYEREMYGKTFLTYPATAPSRLLVFFSGNVGRKTYNRYSWYWDETERWKSNTACLFLNDVDSHWYVGRQGEQDRRHYRDIILASMDEAQIKPEEVYLIGGSMGGYGALLYAIELGLRGVIAVNPQLCRQSALRYKEPSWERKIAECGVNFRDLADEIHRYEHVPLIYLEHSSSACDVAGLDEFIQSVRAHRGFLMLKASGEPNHFTENPTRAQVDALVAFMETIP